MKICSKTFILRAVSLLLVAVMPVALAACGDDPGTTSSAVESGSSTVDTTTSENAGIDVTSADGQTSENTTTNITTSSNTEKESSTMNNQTSTSKTESKVSSRPATTTAAPTSSEVDLTCAGYDYRKDSFYKKSKIYVSWINTWYGSTESWYNLADKQSKYTAKLKVNGEYVTPDNNKQAHREVIFNQAKDAGINVLAMDLTNGYNGWSRASKSYQQLCFNNGMKFSVAVHPRISDGSSNIETICEFVWKNYAGPGEATYSSAFLYKNGKPLMVLYCTIAEYKAATKITTGYAGKFSFVWASGEDSKADKWGWQLVAQDGPQLSSDSMFVTCSISWNSPNGSKDSWRKSLAFLDFCFLAEKEANPKFTIVGMIDDLHERNGWMKMDTTNVVYEIPKVGDNTVPTICRALQMRDIYGNISEDAYYNRVKSWINGTVKPFNTGGLIADGAYTLTNVGNGKKFGVDRPAPGATRIPSTDVGRAFQRGNMVSTAMETYYWFYYLGNNEYRIIKLSSGLSLQPDNGKLVQQYENTSADQRWTLQKVEDGVYQIINKTTGEAICDANGSDSTITLAAADSGSATQQWQINPVANRTFK